jgi:hypothetical protein
MNLNEHNQMELSLGSKSRRLARKARRQRRERAQWWFAKMREVVGSAMEWTPENRARPEQGHLALTLKRS